jgi:hypothetical protein
MIELKKVSVIKLLYYLIPLFLDAALLSTYLQGGIIYWLDSNFPFNPIIWLNKIFLDYWNDPFFPGAPNAYSQDSLFIGLFIYLFYDIFHLSLYISEFLYLLIFLYLSQIGFIKLLGIIEKIFDKKIDKYTYVGALAGGFLYTWGFYAYSPPILGVNYPFFVFYSLFPLFLYFSIKYVFLDKDYITFSLFSIYLILFSGTQFTTFTFLLWAIVIYVLIMFSMWKLSKKGTLGKLMSRNAIIFLFSIVAGLEQLYQTINASIGAYNVGTHQKFLGKPIVISETLSTYESYHIQTVFSLFSNYDFVGLLVFVSLVAFVFGIEKDKISKFLLSILFPFILVGGLLTGIIDVIPLYSLSSTPIGFAVIGLMYSIQFIFSGFVLSFTSSLTFSYVIPWAISFINSNYKKILAIIVILIILSSYIYSFRIGEYHAGFRAFNLPVSATNIFYPPSELVNTGNYLSSHAAYYNILEFPQQYASGMYDDNGTKAVWYTIYPLSDYIYGTVIKSPAVNVVYPLYEYFPSCDFKNITNYFVLLGAKYIVLNKQEYPGPGVPLGHAGGYPWNYTKFIDALSRAPNITLLMENKYYNVYVINLNVSLLYPSEGLVENLSCNQLFFLYSNNTLKAQTQSVIYGLDAVNITNISDVHIKIVNNYWNEVYEIQVNASKPFYLVFDEGYSQLWEVIIHGEINTHHYIANGYANAWLMPAGKYEAVLELGIVSTVHLLYIITFSGLIILALIYVIYKFKNFKK